MSDNPAVEIPKNDPPPEHEDTPQEVDLPSRPLPANEPLQDKGVV